MRTSESRFDSSILTDAEKKQLHNLLELAERSTHPCLKGDGKEIPLPEPIFKLLVKIIDDMRRGNAIVLIREDETFTTQASANYLGMSRQHFVNLIESGKIPFHRVGSHRRVHFKDLRDYALRRDKERRAVLGGLFDKLAEEGHYDSEYNGEDAQ